MDCHECDKFFKQIVRHRKHEEFMGAQWNMHILELQRQNKANQRKSKYIKRLNKELVAEKAEYREMWERYALCFNTYKTVQKELAAVKAERDELLIELKKSSEAESSLIRMIGTEQDCGTHKARLATAVESVEKLSKIKCYNGIAHCKAQEEAQKTLAELRADEG